MAEPGAVPDLATLQRQFYDRVTSGAPADGLAATGDLDVYAQMYAIRLLDALVEDYPKLHAALGDLRFRQRATTFLRAHPPRSFTLRELGRGFAAHLRTDDHAPAWAADLAALERARMEVFDGADAAPLAHADVVALGEQLPELALTWVPASVVVPIAWTVDDLWSAIEDASDVSDARDASDDGGASDAGGASDDGQDADHDHGASAAPGDDALDDRANAAPDDAAPDDDATADHAHHEHDHEHDHAHHDHTDHDHADHVPAQYAEPTPCERTVLVWRRARSVLHRTLEPDEAALAAQVAAGARFAALCEVLSALHGDDASPRAAQLLLRWLASENLTAAVRHAI